MEALVFWLLAGVVLVYMVRRTKRKTREIEAEAEGHAKATSLKQLQGENRQSARDAMSSKGWKQRAKKAKAAVKSTDAAPPSTHSVATSSGGHLRFVYEDSQGNVTAREVSSWNDDGIYIEGYCHKAREIRTFRRDRVVEFLEGEELLGPALEEFDPEPVFTGPAMEILFTGFSADDREDLEADAEEAGLLVRKTITKNLNFICAGPRAGSSKLSKARVQGCTILSEDEFQKMLATGEVPA